MGDIPPKIQPTLASTAAARSEAPRAALRGTVSPIAARDTERHATSLALMEKVVERANCQTALKRVLANKGSPGIDGMTVKELSGCLKTHWPAIKERLLTGTYQPQPVQRVEIPKPGGGMRSLGIPTALDRFIQQAILHVLQPEWDSSFSDASYGFRPGRSAHQAVARAQEYIAAGYEWVVDIDLEKFFDRVNHDKLMGRVAKRVADKRLLKLIRAFLNAGAMENGLVSLTDTGTPQGGPLSPLLSNLVLDELDRELERRGHRFVRYADDCNIYVKSERAGQRVMASIVRFIEKKLKLKVNWEKSAVAQPGKRKFLGFSFTREERPRRRIAPQAIARFKANVRALTQRTRGTSVEQTAKRLTAYLDGWKQYFGFCETPSVLERLDTWIRRRLRAKIWKQWKQGTTRFAELRKRGIGKDLAAQTAGSCHGPWRLSNSPALAIGLPNAFFDSLGLIRLAKVYGATRRTAVYGPVRTVV